MKLQMPSAPQIKIIVHWAVNACPQFLELSTSPLKSLPNALVASNLAATSSCSRNLARLNLKFLAPELTCMVCKTAGLIIQLPVALGLFFRKEFRAC